MQLENYQNQLLPTDYAEEPGRVARNLKQWLWWATHSRLEHMRDFARMIRHHEDNIFIWLQMPINKGTIEKLNNKTKDVSNKAYGPRTVHNYTCNISRCMANMPMPKSCTHLCENLY